MARATFGIKSSMELLHANTVNPRIDGLIPNITPKATKSATSSLATKTTDLRSYLVPGWISLSSPGLGCTTSLTTARRARSLAPEAAMSSTEIIPMNLAPDGDSLGDAGGRQSGTVPLGLAAMVHAALSSVSVSWTSRRRGSSNIRRLRAA
jgi:hypothetical protein